MHPHGELSSISLQSAFSEQTIEALAQHVQFTPGVQGSSTSAAQSNGWPPQVLSLASSFCWTLLMNASRPARFASVLFRYSTADPSEAHVL
eukprot:1221550-Rhodomonas_salina.1